MEKKIEHFGIYMVLTNKIISNKPTTTNLTDILMSFMRTPGSCSICGVMGHTKRTCRIVRLRREGEQMGQPLTQEEEQRVKETSGKNLTKVHLESVGIHTREN